MRVIARIVLLLTFPGVICAQVPKGNIFAGYSFLGADVPFSPRQNLNGWEASLEGKVLPFLGIVADGGGHYGTSLIPVCTLPPAGPPGGRPGAACSPVNGNIHTVLFGPRASVSIKGFRPFAHVLVGVGHSSGAINSDLSLASAYGGGLDIKIAPVIGWRFQGDYIHTHFADASQGHGRFSSGIVLRF